MNRYDGDVLAAGWQQKSKKVVPEIALERGMVLEDATTGFCGAVTRWENGLVVLEGRGDKRRSFPIGYGFLLEGKPVAVKVPPRAAGRAGAVAGRTASGSVAGPAEKAKVALPSRIYVEGRHDAELVEKIWGDDLRHVGVVVEYLGGIDDLVSIVAEFQPGPGRRLGVLVDHLVAGTKESRIVAGLDSAHVLVTGHPFIDIWQAVLPQRVGLDAWPQVSRRVDWKTGISTALGRPVRSQADIAATWQWILGRVRDWHDLDPALPREVARLIDCVTTD